MSANLWNEIRGELKMAMKKEVGVMREILSNMHQEEAQRLFGDQRSLDQLLQERIPLIKRLGELRQMEFEATCKLENFIPLSKNVEQFLALDDEHYSEIMLMRDQISALAERIDFQKQRNQALPREVALNPLPAYNRQKKVGIITCERPENKT